MRICYDLDNTLCHSAGGDYDNSTPIDGAKEHLQEMKAQGHTIIIQTARGMGRTNGNEYQAQYLFTAFTNNQLREWGFEFDELFLGKPAADLYVDDKGLRVLQSNPDATYHTVELWAEGRMAI